MNLSIYTQILTQIMQAEPTSNNVYLLEGVLN